jgi:two-component system, OmpR family, alkaline phosphatase synthesis response regulator PhoP
VTILLAEDDPVTREAVAELLEAEGHEVLAACDGGEALDLWKRSRPALVLLDIMMPVRSGYDVCRSIRAVDPSTPMVFLSAKSEEVDVVLGLELGADDFLRKPFGKHELLARVRVALRKRKGTAGSEGIGFGSWVVYPKRLRAERDGGGIDLSPREVKIISLLVSRTGEVVSRDELLNVCWGLEYFPDSRTLDQHVLNLRKKLEENPSRPELIETVRGAGYRYPG